MFLSMKKALMVKSTSCELMACEEQSVTFVRVLSVKRKKSFSPASRKVHVKLYFKRHFVHISSK